MRWSTLVWRGPGEVHNRERAHPRSWALDVPLRLVGARLSVRIDSASGRRARDGVRAGRDVDLSGRDERSFVFVCGGPGLPTLNLSSHMPPSP
jgi:hypothetical protein